jgi:hypothetical protein
MPNVPVIYGVKLFFSWRCVMYILSENGNGRMRRLKSMKWLKGVQPEGLEDLSAIWIARVRAKTGIATDEIFKDRRNYWAADG